VLLAADLNERSLRTFVEESQHERRPQLGLIVAD
jgi:hypothetical protein